MTKKLPQPGEWWIAPSGTILRIVGTKLNGQILYEMDINGSCGSAKAEWWEDWHHEPLCDSFDWKPAAPIDPGEGWELLPKGTVLQDGDECQQLIGKNWAPTIYAGQRIGAMDYTSNTYRRRKRAETWPKYYICGTWDHAAYVRKDSDGRITTICRDGSECRWDVETKLTAVIPEGWREVTKAEAVARVKPVEPVATDRTPDNRTAREAIKAMLKILNETVGVDADHNAEAFCVGEQWLTDNPEAVERIATPPATAATESPDDWVDITDPEHVLRYCDEMQWHKDGSWHKVTGYVGRKLSSIGEWWTAVRCRRRDLPPQPRLKRTDTFGRDVTEEYGLHDETDIVTYVCDYCYAQGHRGHMQK